MGRLLITAFGDAGAGKGTNLGMVALAFGCVVVDMGDKLREKAAERGLSLHELHELMLMDRSVDDELDEYVRRLPDQHERLIISSRTAWFLHPNSIRIYLACREDVTALRISLREKVTSSQALAKERARVAVDADRYRQFLGITAYPPPHDLFQVVVDTSNLNPEEVQARLIEQLTPSCQPSRLESAKSSEPQRLNNNPRNQILGCGGRSLYPLGRSRTCIHALEERCSIH